MSKTNRNPPTDFGRSGPLHDDDMNEVNSFYIDDFGNDRGFGGVAGANRHVFPYDHSTVETLPAARAANYGTAPGLNKQYGSRGMGDAGDQVSGTVAGARTR